GFPASVAEHDALVSGAFVLLFGAVDTQSDISRLWVQQHLHIRRFPVKPWLLVPDVTNGHSGHMGDEVAGDRIRTARLSRDNDVVRRRQCLGGYAHLPGIEASPIGLAKEQVDDLVGNPVTDFVRMPLRDGFASEKVRSACHECPRQAVDRRLMALLYSLWGGNQAHLRRRPSLCSQSWPACACSR